MGGIKNQVVHFLLIYKQIVLLNTCFLLPLILYCEISFKFIFISKELKIV